MKSGIPFTGRRPSRVAGAVLLVALLLVNGGCATYSAKMADLRPQLASGDFDGALKTVEKNSGRSDILLSRLERGLLLHYADRFAESNEAFAAAERTAEQLYGRSIGEGALSLLTSDANVAYRPRPYEMAFVPYFKALNYAWLGQPDEAVVEARSASQMLAKYVDATLGGLREEDKKGLARIRNDAFLLYFSGMLYDWDGELNDAFIAYRNAAQAFEQNAALLGLEVPTALATDLARTADRLGFTEELVEVARACPSVFAGTGDTTATLRALREASRWPAGRGEVVLMIETGYVPQMTQTRFDFPVFSQESYNDPNRASWQLYSGMGNYQMMSAGQKIEYWVSVAAPELQDDRPGMYRGVRASAGTIGGNVGGARTVNLARTARVTFDAEKPTIFFRTILRGLTKYLAKRGVEKAGGQGVGLLANLLGAVTETADTRSWLTLPEQIHLVRFSLPPGVHDLRVELLDARGRVAAEHVVSGVDVRPGEWTFESRRVF